MAIHSPLLETTIEGARGLLLNITGGEDLTLFEVNEAAGVISEAADDDANIIFGAVVDEKLKGKISITVVATGFGDEVKRLRRRPAGRRPAPRRPGPSRAKTGARRSAPRRGSPRRTSTSRRSSISPRISSHMSREQPRRCAPMRRCRRTSRRARLDLDVFDGLFDLLVTLILRDEIDIWEVRVSPIIAEYVVKLADSGEFDLDATSQFVVLVAALLEMKSRLLLEEEVEDGSRTSTPTRRRGSCSSGWSATASSATPPGAAHRLEAHSARLYRSAPVPAELLRRRIPEGALPARALAEALGPLLREPPVPDTSHLADLAVSLVKELRRLRVDPGRRG